MINGYTSRTLPLPCCPRCNRINRNPWSSGNVQSSCPTPSHRHRTRCAVSVRGPGRGSKLGECDDDGNRFGSVFDPEVRSIDVGCAYSPESPRRCRTETLAVADESRAGRSEAMSPEEFARLTWLTGQTNTSKARQARRRCSWFGPTAEPSRRIASVLARCVASGGSATLGFGSTTM